MTIGERLLLRFCRPVNAPDYEGGTARVEADPSCALDFVERTVPGFANLVAGKTVCDYGCGYGYQALAMATRGAAEVAAFDLPRPELIRRWRQIETMQYPIHFSSDRPTRAIYDLILSCSAFEHYRDPETELRRMIELCRPGGRVVVTFAEPWFSPRGSHMDGMTRLPWVNLLFSERTMLRVRARYRPDAAASLEETEDGLNRMTVARFERIVRRSGQKIEFLKLYAVRRMPLVTRIPVLRELLTSAAACVLTVGK
jgi:SAM-dependent methyltransferase